MEETCKNTGFSLDSAMLPALLQANGDACRGKGVHALMGSAPLKRSAQSPAGTITEGDAGALTEGDRRRRAASTDKGWRRLTETKGRGAPRASRISLSWVPAGAPENASFQGVHAVCVARRSAHPLAPPGPSPGPPPAGSRSTLLLLPIPNAPCCPGPTSEHMPAEQMTVELVQKLYAEQHSPAGHRATVSPHTAPDRALGRADESTMRPPHDRSERGGEGGGAFKSQKQPLTA